MRGKDLGSFSLTLALNRNLKGPLPQIGVGGSTDIINIFTQLSGQTGISIQGIAAVVSARRSIPPIRSDFSHPLLFEIADGLYNATPARRTIAALGSALDSTVWLMEGVKAPRGMVFERLVNAPIIPYKGSVTDCLEKEGLPIESLQQDAMSRGLDIFEHIFQVDFMKLQGLNHGKYRLIDIYYLYCIEQGALAKSAEDRMLWYQIAILIEPSFPIAYTKILNLPSEEVDLNTKEKYVDAWIDHSPNDTDAYIAKAVVLAEINHFEGVVSCLSQALEAIGRSPDISELKDMQRLTIYSMRAQALAALNRIHRSVLDCEEALKFNPENGSLCALYASMLDRAGRTDESLAQVIKATQFSPEDASTWLLRASLLLKKKKRTDARIALARALELDPTNDSTRIHLARLQAEIAILQVQTEMLEAIPDSTTATERQTAAVLKRALPFFDQTIDKSQDKTTATIAKAQFLFQLGKKDAAIACAKEIAGWRELPDHYIPSLLSQSKDRHGFVGN